MSGTAVAVASAAGLFAGTNLDDLVVLAVLFSSARATGTPRPWQVWAGQAGGFACLVAASAVAALGLTLVPQGWAGLLGLVPLGMGLWGVVRAVRARREGGPVPVAPATGWVSVMALTVANGTDNLTVYPPVFRTVGTATAVVTVVVFALGVVLWCLLGAWLGGHDKVVPVVRRWGHWIVPVVFVVIGVCILVGTGVLTRLI